MKQKPIVEYSVSKDKNLVIIAEHASNELPASYKDLGLKKNDLSKHIGYDIGIDYLSKILSDELKASLFLGKYSRLLIDLNRSPKDPTLVRSVYDGIIVPGNLSITEAEKKLRLEKYFHPFHTAISNHISGMVSLDQKPVIINIHSFTKQLSVDKQKRPWHISVLAMDEKVKTDLRLSHKLHELLIKDLGKEKVGYNQPYSAQIDGTHSVAHHAFLKNYPYLIIEIRQDLITSKKDQEKVGKYLSRLIKEALSVI